MTMKIIQISLVVLLICIIIYYNQNFFTGLYDFIRPFINFKGMKKNVEKFEFQMDSSNVNVDATDVEDVFDTEGVLTEGEDLAISDALKSVA